jgi:hypothetical protein
MIELGQHLRLSPKSGDALGIQRTAGSTLIAAWRLRFVSRAW